MANTYSRTTTGSVDLDAWVFDVDGNGAVAPHGGGPIVLGLDVAGSLGGGAIQWQSRPLSGSLWMNVADAVTDPEAAAQMFTPLPPGHIRPVLSGSTSPAITCYAI